MAFGELAKSGPDGLVIRMVIRGESSGASELTDPMLTYEYALWNAGVSIIAGVDEAGRGPLAGPVVAAAVVFNCGSAIPDAIDSKQLSPRNREKLFYDILVKARCWSVSASSAAVIDRMGILPSTMRAMKQALDRLPVKPQFALIDGNRCPSNLSFPTQAIIDGDAKSRSIAAASVIAKVLRDRLMKRLGLLYPDWGFERHKGYGTAEHLIMLACGNSTPHHRRSFAPLRQPTFRFPSE